MRLLLNDTASPNLKAVEQEPETRFEIETMRPAELPMQVFHGIGIAFGLALLWVMESVRNNYFRLLDRLNLKPRPPRRVSAFPPGRPRRRILRQAERA